MPPLMTGITATPINEPSTFNGTEPECATTLRPNSSQPVEPCATLNEYWAKPATLHDFAKQANTVATMVLNGDIDPDIARLYSSVARTVIQGMSIEVTRARFLKTMPELSLD